MKTERRPRILVRLSFRDLCDSNLFDSRAFDDMAISMSQEGDKKRKGRLWVQETQILEKIFVILTEDSSVKANDT